MPRKGNRDGSVLLRFVLCFMVPGSFSDWFLILLLLVTSTPSRAGIFRGKELLEVPDIPLCNKTLEPIFASQGTLVDESMFRWEGGCLKSLLSSITVANLASFEKSFSVEKPQRICGLFGRCYVKIYM